MPTGIEEAGLVLAVLPLLISFLDGYHDGLESMMRWLKFKRTQQALYRKLKAERVVYENCCYKLVDFVSGDGGRSATVLFRDPLGPRWQDPDLLKRVRTVLGDDQWETFEGVILEIKENVGAFLRRIQKDAPNLETSPLYSKLIAINARFRTASSRREADLDELHRLIDIFQNLVSGLKIRRRVLDSGCNPETFRTFRQRASDLCKALTKSFTCACPTGHNANLCIAEPIINPTGGSVLEISFCFDPNEWRRTAFQQRPPGYSHRPMCSQVPNLCARLRNLAHDSLPEEGGCLGHVSVDDLYDDICYCINAVSREKHHQVLSLHDILCCTPPHRMGFPFAPRDQIKLAIIFATALLSLHSTPWLKEMWTSRDIIFLPNPDDPDNTALLQPYVVQSFPAALISSHVAAPPMVRNAALYALGKILIQIVANRPLIYLTDLQADAMGDFVDPEMKAAAALEPTICRMAGATWSEVIRKCLYCDFDVATSAATFDNDDFLSKVYGQVITPLAEALEALDRGIR